MASKNFMMPPRTSMTPANTNQPSPRCSMARLPCSATPASAWHPYSNPRRQGATHVRYPGEPLDPARGGDGADPGGAASDPAAPATPQKMRFAATCRSTHSQALRPSPKIAASKLYGRTPCNEHVRMASKIFMAPPDTRLIPAYSTQPSSLLHMGLSSLHRDHKPRRSPRSLMRAESISGVQSHNW